MHGFPLLKKVSVFFYGNYRVAFTTVQITKGERAPEVVFPSFLGHSDPKIGVQPIIVAHHPHLTPPKKTKKAHLTRPWADCFSRQESLFDEKGHFRVHPTRFPAQIIRLYTLRIFSFSSSGCAGNKPTCLESDNTSHGTCLAWCVCYIRTHLLSSVTFNLAKGVKVNKNWILHGKTMRVEKHRISLYSRKIEKET